MKLLRARKLLPAIAASIAVGVSAGGCGGPAATTIDPVAQAAEVTSHVSGAHMALSAQLTTPVLAQPFTITGEGYFNSSRLEGKFNFQASGLPASATAQLPAGGLHVEALFKFPAIYVGSSVFAAPALQGKLHGARWIKLDLGRFSQALGVNLLQLSGAQSSPAQFLRYLKAVGGTPERVGSALVRGVQTAHYRATIDLHKLPDVLPPALASRLRAQIGKLIAQTGTSKIPIDVWVDGQHLLRRLAFELSLSASEQRAQMKLSLELFDYGPTPPVLPPPASEVFDATQLTLGALGKAGG
jgi:hypothetical protein